MIAASQLVDLWDQCAGQHPVDRAITLLSAWLPEKSRTELAAVSIGRRDTLLLDFREAMFGPGMNAFADCPACNSHLEFGLTTTDLRLDPPEPSAGIHLPDSFDLAAAAHAPGPEEARRILAERCCPGGGEVEIAQMAELIAELDPQADMTLRLQCASCGHSWPELLDISAYLWTEVCAAAKRIVREVHQLALAYGWSERDILEMSGTRRSLYLEMLA